MTKEEAIKIIEYTFLNADGHLKPLDFDYGGGKGIVEALRMAIEELSQLSLPSNLDEAAEEYKCNAMRRAESETYDHPLPAFHDGYMAGVSAETVDAFKAGAKCMAGQGVTVETPIYRDYNTPADEGIIFGVLPLFSKLMVASGNKVVVQIRKK